MCSRASLTDVWMWQIVLQRLADRPESWVRDRYSCFAPQLLALRTAVLWPVSASSQEE